MITGLALSFPVSDFVRPTGCRLSLFDPNSLIKVGEVLVSLTPVETWGSGFTWLVRSGISGFPRNRVPPKSCRCSCRRSKRVQGGVLFDCAGFQASSVLNHDRMVSWQGWTACPLTVVASKTVGRLTVRSNNTRTVVSKLLDWMFGIIQGSWKPCPSWLDFGPNTSIDSFFQSFTEHVTLHTWWLTCGVLVFTEHTTFWMTPHTKTLNRSLNRGVQRFDVE